MIIILFKLFSNNFKEMTIHLKLQIELLTLFMKLKNLYQNINFLYQLHKKIQVIFQFLQY